MSFVSSKEIILDAFENRYAVGAFAVHNLELMKAVISGAESFNSPVILQTTPDTVRYMGLEYTVDAVKSLAGQSKVPVALHLDHGDTFKIAMQCLRAGYTSIMIDGSSLDFEENIVLVKKVAEASQAMGVPVEAELGAIARNNGNGEKADRSHFTNPSLAEEFVLRTGIDFLAPSFGTVHGIYADEPDLDFHLLEKIRGACGIPLVMHGASGVCDEDIRKAIGCGISKINYSTELKQAFSSELRRYLTVHQKASDPRKYFITARECAEELVKEKIAVLLQSPKVL
ncbi:class II fructose-bisphosphate aldolase [Bacillus sp. FJAT-42376]|uniref:class II fructose-bisphosphate aldolase n=1 Tax=Bacillus sp. FJAT-42376 TaxID=2014076 RepID=UPI000F4FBE0B|nr:class II fructose-bisphosphate aldolase [Bacillus sp. FJAT-42376]AZB43748.1 class II fructose-bisphosphate aldolase [Bacillus sp. FJAT-42376]